MALYGARYGHLAPVRTLARRIVLDQSQEVDLMVRLLRLYGASPLAFPTSQALSSSDVGAVLNESQPQRTQAPLQNAWGK